MAEMNAICALAITPETLSAWRDKQVKAATAEQLDHHVPTCAACQRELTQFEMVARALYRQRELVPGNRVWRGVEAQINGRRHAGPHINTRALLSGISGIVVVALLAIVFARVLGGSGKGTFPTATAATTVLPTGIVTATTAPTVTGAPAVTPPPGVFVAQAWGATAAKQTLTTPSDATHTFQATNITLDGTKLLGDRFTFSSPPSNNQGPSGAQAGSLDIATQRFTDIGVIPSTAGLFDRPGCCMTDGRFLVAEDSDQPGVTCGVCHVRVWSYDSQTGQPAHIVTTSATAGGEIDNSFLDHGILALSVLKTTTSFTFIDLATLQTTTFTPGGGNQQASAPIMSFNWPYVIYFVTTATGTGNDTARIHDVTTKSDIALPQGTTTGAIDSAVITGDTLFYSQGNVGTFEVDHFTTPGAQPHLLTTLTGTLTGVNARVLLIDNNGTAGYMAWDRAEQRLVQLAALSASNNEGIISAALSGNQLIVTQASSAYAAQQVAIYDTSQLPTHG